MREAERTTRQRIADYLRSRTASVTGLAAEIDIAPDEALSHVDHLAASLAETDEQLLVASPECLDCGFDDFDDLANRPSRCPRCKAERIRDPEFRIE